MTDRNGVPLAVMLSSANVHDSTVLEELVDAVELVRGPGKGRSRKRPEKLHADKGYNFPRCRRALRKGGIVARIGRQGIDSSARWLSRFRRLAIRYEKRADLHEASCTSDAR